MTDARDDDAHSGRPADASAPWHHSTAKVLGASVAALAAIGLIVAGAMFVSRSGESPREPTSFIDPSFSSITTASSSATVSSATTTRISPPLTTDLDLPPESAPPPPPPASETSSTRGRSTTQEEEESEESGQESSPRTTTRNRPRLNETRTLYPRP